MKGTQRRNGEKNEKKEAADWIENKEWRINGSTSLERPDTM
jgi:hypothetical protein